MERAGTQGVELVMWLAARAALPGKVTQLHKNYHIPISNTAAGLMLLENQQASSICAVSPPARRYAPQVSGRSIVSRYSGTEHGQPRRSCTA